MNEEIENKTFRSLGLSEKTLLAIEKKGFEEPSEIQAACIPLLLQPGTEVVGQAQTGTGKTAAFALPILETVSEENKAVQALILAPTRELALQVSEEINSLKGDRRTEVTPIYGGASMELQLRKLKRGVQIVVGTPGRILDHIKRGTLVLDQLEFLVLDEADEMLDMGFIEDIEEVLKNVPEEKRMLMFSATMPPQIQKLAETFMKNPQMIRTQKMDAATTQADQIYFEVKEADKLEALTRIIDRDSEFYGVVFCRTKLQCDEIGHKLQGRGYDAEALHGDLSQREREIILRKMKERVIRILIATDVAARGLDIQDLTHVINYSLPHDPEIYIHRVGRTGRAGKEGTAITFITPSEARRFSYIKKASKADIRKEQVPTAKEVIGSKKERIFDSLTSALSEEATEEYKDLAGKLLAENDPQEAFASLLAFISKDALDISQYKDLSIEAKKRERRRKSNDEGSLERTSYEGRGREDRERPYDKVKTPNVDEEGLTRLFIARGRNDGLTKRGLADIIIDQTGVRNEDLRDIQVMEDFSFINAPYDAAEHILRVFESRKYDGKSIVTRARREDKKPSKKSTEKKTSEKKERKEEGEDFIPVFYDDDEKPRRKKKDSYDKEKKAEEKRSRKEREYSEEELEFLEYQRAAYEDSYRKKARTSSGKKERKAKAAKPAKKASKRGRR
ncbi:MAG: DEAD/DEAH box helicase [Spirochaetales bacterium]|nr:DEAD/DEAH box helicase [Candidatus Physcosoma equi]